MNEKTNSPIAIASCVIVTFFAGILVANLHLQPASPVDSGLTSRFNSQNRIQSSGAAGMGSATMLGHQTPNLGLTNTGSNGEAVAQWIQAIAGVGSAFAAFAIFCLAIRDHGINRRQADTIRRQTQLLEKQTDIQRLQHVAAHRPKVVIRSVTLIPGNAEVGIGQRTVMVNYLLSNIGGTRAKIIEGGFVARSWSKNFAPFPIGTHNTPWDKEHGVLEPGQSLEIYLRADIAPAEIDQIITSLELEKLGQKPVNYKDFVFCGSILYVDDNGVRRRTSTWRQLEPHRLRMVPINDPDYEYAD